MDLLKKYNDNLIYNKSVFYLKINYLYDKIIVVEVIMETLILPIATQLLAVLLLFVFFSKERLKSDETKIYSKMIIINFVYALMAIITFVYAKTHGNNSIISVMQKIYMSLMLILIIYIFIYNISLLKFKKSFKKYIKLIIGILSTLLIISVFITPLTVINKKNILDGFGLSYNIVLYATIIYFILIIISIIIIFIKNRSGFTKDIPFISLIALYIVGLLIRKYYPSIMFENFLFTFMLFIMYFTIENPDLKVVNELLRNKELVEKQMEDKSRFLFEVSQDIKIPTKNILGIVKNYSKLNDDLDKKEAMRIIESNANDLLFKLNNVLDISKIDASKIKISNNYYDAKLFFDSIKSMIQNAIKNKNIKLFFKISNNVPTKLNGDEIKLKQVLMSVLINSIENTENGFIKVYIDAIVRYDVARLIIKIEDTGKGMSLYKINSILDDNRELTKEEVSKLNKLDMDLKATIKVIKLLGGSFNIKSTENKGSIFTIVIDQVCDIKNDAEDIKEIKKYSSDFFGKKRVLIVDDTKEELFKISSIISNYSVDINTTMMGKECIDKIKNKEFYNLIIIDDDLKIDSALNVLNELNKIKKFKVPVIVMLEKNKKHYKKYYLEDGFTDVILKENLTDEIKRIMEKYI